MATEYADRKTRQEIMLVAIEHEAIADELETLDGSCNDRRDASGHENNAGQYRAAKLCALSFPAPPRHFPKTRRTLVSAITGRSTNCDAQAGAITQAAFVVLAVRWGAWRLKLGAK